MLLSEDSKLQSNIYGTTSFMCILKATLTKRCEIAFFGSKTVED